MRSKSLAVKTTFVVLLAGLLVYECRGRTNIFVRDDQIYISRHDGKEEKVTSSEEEKYLPVLSPFDENIVLYHGKVKRDSVPATDLVIVDVVSRRVEKRIPFHQRCRSVLCVDWLTERYVGVKVWNRGANFWYVVVDLNSGTILKRYYVGSSALSHSKKKIAFEKGIPGGYIPNPAYKTLIVMVDSFCFPDGPEKVTASVDPITIYGPCGRGQGSDKDKLRSNIYWANDDSHVSFVCERGSERFLVTCATGSDTNVLSPAEITLTEKGALEGDVLEKLESLMSVDTEKSEHESPR